MKSKKLPTRNKITKPRVPKASGQSSELTEEMTEAQMLPAAVGGASIMENQDLGANPQDNKNKFQAPKKPRAMGTPMGLSNEIKAIQKNKKPGVY